MNLLPIGSIQLILGWGTIWFQHIRKNTDFELNEAKYQVPEETLKMGLEQK